MPLRHSFVYSQPPQRVQRAVDGAKERIKDVPISIEAKESITRAFETVQSDRVLEKVAWMEMEAAVRQIEMEIYERSLAYYRTRLTIDRGEGRSS